MYESATQDANSAQAAEITDPDQEIATKKAEQAEHERALAAYRLKLLQA
jgi:hypothetical protein